MKAKTVKTPTSPQIQNLESKISNLESQLARALADYANLEKRFERDSSSIVKFANASLIEKLLEIRDHLGMAAATGDSSLKMILGNLDKLLVEEGVSEVKTDAGFDPSTMECHETAPGEKDQIIQEVRRGYKLHDRVLRPARVIVGSGAPIKPSN